MKSLAEYLLECDNKTYDFKIKIACMEMDNDVVDRIEHALSAYGVSKISKPKHLPVVDKPLDFPNFGSCDIHLIVASLKYPCTDEQIRVALGTQGRIPLHNVVVIPANQPEELMRDCEEEEKECKENSEGQEQVGQKRLDGFLKDLQSRKFEFAAKPPKAPKTTNDLPQNNISPVKGGKK